MRRLIADTVSPFQAAANNGKMPKVLVMGALGRCGTGACNFARKAGVPEENIIKWDINETKKGGPFPEILDAGKCCDCLLCSCIANNNDPQIYLSIVSI